MALYRKYRPASFAEVVGQEHVTEPLSVALSSGRINHAYLFSGPRGCGKTSSARILARSLNCVQGPTADPCGRCDSCEALAPGGPGTLDVTELDAASHGGVDDTRDLRERAFFAPASARYRVLIIDEAHMVTNAGFNALLKIVEEPPEHLIFIFATTEPDKVLPTIRSRTHHYPFRLLTPTAMRGLLERVCQQEGVVVEPTVLPLVIRSGAGSPRDTLSVLDQLMAGAGEEGITYPRAVALLGATEVTLIDDTVDALAASDGATLFRTVDKVVESGLDPRRFATDLLQRLRDLIMVQSVPQAIERGLVEAPVEQAETMHRQAEKIGPGTLARCADMVHEGMASMRGATSPRLLLEILCAKLLLPSADNSMEALLQRVESLESGTARPAAAAPGPGGQGPGPAGGAAAPQQTGQAPPAGAPPQSEPEGRPKFVRRSQQQAAQAEPAAPAEPSAPADTSAPAEPSMPAGPAAPASSAGAAPSGPAEAPTTAAPHTPAASPAPAAPETSPAPAPAAPAASAPDAAAAPDAPTAPSAPEPSPSAAQDPGPAPESAPPTSAPASEPTSVPPVPTSSADAPQADPWHETPGQTATAASPPADGQDAAAAPSSPSPSSSSSPGLEAEDIRRALPAIREAVRKRTRTVEVMLAGATVAGVEGRTIHLVHDSAPLAKRLAQPHNATVITESVSEVVGGEWALTCSSGSGPAAGGAQAPGRGAAGPGTPAGPGAPQQAEPQGWERRVRAADAGQGQGGARGQTTPGHAGGRSGGAGHGGYDDAPPPPEEPEPEPAEPEDPSGPPVSEDEMVDEARSGPQNLDHRTGEDIALALLKEHLGARPIDR